MESYHKTTGPQGRYVCVPIGAGPLEQRGWACAKEFARAMEGLYPDVITAEYRIAKRPTGRVLVDYNQNAWGRTLASIYSVRPKPRAPVSMPVTWEEIARGIEIEDFRLDNARSRLKKVGDLWKPLLAKRGRVRLETYLDSPQRSAPKTARRG